MWLNLNTVKSAIRTTIKLLQEQANRLQLQSMRIIKSDPTLARMAVALKTIKGFGPVTIALLLAKVDFQLFERARQLVKYAGLDAVPWQSGKTNRSKGISRAGHAGLRSAMYYPAIVAMTHDPLNKAFAERLEKSGACNKQIICAVMARLLRVAFAVVRDEMRKQDAIAPSKFFC